MRKKEKKYRILVGNRTLYVKTFSSALQIDWNWMISELAGIIHIIIIINCGCQHKQCYLVSILPCSVVSLYVCACTHFFSINMSLKIWPLDDDVLDKTFDWSTFYCCAVFSEMNMNMYQGKNSPEYNTSWIQFAFLFLFFSSSDCHTNKLNNYTHSALCMKIIIIFQYIVSLFGRHCLPNGNVFIFVQIRND